MHPHISNDAAYRFVQKRPSFRLHPGKNWSLVVWLWVRREAMIGKRHEDRNVSVAHPHRNYTVVEMTEVEGLVSGLKGLPRH